MISLYFRQNIGNKNDTGKIDSQCQFLPKERTRTKRVEILIHGVKERLTVNPTIRNVHSNGKITSFLAHRTDIRTFRFRRKIVRRRCEASRSVIQLLVMVDGLTRTREWIIIDGQCDTGELGHHESIWYTCDSVVTEIQCVEIPHHQECKLIDFFDRVVTELQKFQPE